METLYLHKQIAIVVYAYRMLTKLAEKNKTQKNGDQCEVVCGASAIEPSNTVWNEHSI